MEVCLKNRILVAAFSITTAWLSWRGAHAPKILGIFLLNFACYLALLTAWMNMTMDVLISAAYMVIFGCILWVLI